MTERRPLVLVGGDIHELTAPDTVDDAVLPEPQVYVGDSAPVTSRSQYVWFQTNMGAGEDFTVWIEDGDA